MIQLNVRKQGEVHDSLMNDEEIRDATVLAIQEPHARRIQGRLLTTPMSHHKWTKMVPSVWREGRWPIRSMLSSKFDGSYSGFLRVALTMSNGCAGHLQSRARNSDGGVVVDTKAFRKGSQPIRRLC